MRISFVHRPHPHIDEHEKAGPPKTRAPRAGLNDRVAARADHGCGDDVVRVHLRNPGPLVVPDAIKGGLLTFVQWVSQTFIQLVMLSVIMVGQSILGQAADKRAEATYKDAEATFHEGPADPSHLRPRTTP